MTIKIIYSTFKVFLLIVNFSFFSQSDLCGQQPPSLNSSLKELKEYHSSTVSLKSTLNQVSRNFIRFNEQDKEKADELLSEILQLDMSLKNSFLYKTFHSFDLSQKQVVRNTISHQLQASDPLYLELVSFYDLQEHYHGISLLLDSLFIDNIIAEFKSTGEISSENIIQLRYLSTVANLSDDNYYEDEVLNLVQRLYTISKNEANSMKSTKMFRMLYNVIIPKSIGKLLSKRSVKKSIYLLDEPLRIKRNYDVGDSNFAWFYLLKCVLPKLERFGEKYFNVEEFYKNIDDVKKEILTDEVIWLEDIK